MCAISVSAQRRKKMTLYELKKIIKEKIEEIKRIEAYTCYYIPKTEKEIEHFKKMRKEKEFYKDMLFEIETIEGKK